MHTAACPTGMVYQSCGQLCPQTCDNEIANGSCISGCAEGCFCPDNQIVVDGNCAHPVSCPGMYLKCSKTGYFRGENFHKFHESSSICENFTLKMCAFQLLLITIHDDL